MTTPLTFVSAGFGNAVCANRITAVLQPSAAAARRKLRCAKDEDAYLDLTFGRRLKSLLVLDDGT